MAKDAGCASVLLAHHQDDQAETFLLQALRGGGVHGWSGMARERFLRGVRFDRPWLGIRRADIDAYVRERHLCFVEDDSNSDVRYARNRLRLQVMPALEAAFAQAVPTLAQSAQQAQDAASCLKDLAELDLASLRAGLDLHIGGLLALSAPRRRNVLRHWLVTDLGAVPSRSFLDRVSSEVRSEEALGRWGLSFQGELRAYRGLLSWHAEPTRQGEQVGWPPGWATSVRIDGPGRYPVSGEGGAWLGDLVVTQTSSGPGVRMVVGTELTLRSRCGGEQFQRHPRAALRSLKKQYQAAGVPVWARFGPLVWHERSLYWVPGLGLDARVRVTSDDQEDAYTIDWVPAWSE